MKTDKLKKLYDLLSEVDKTYSQLPLNVTLEIEKISQGLSEFAPRKLSRRGQGTEFFESRTFRQEIDEVRNINARLSARAGKPIVIEKEAEIRQHFYLWRDATNSMDYTSNDTCHTKKLAAEIMLLAFAKHLALNEEMISILDGKGTYHGNKAPEWLAKQLLDVTIMTGDMPVVAQQLPRDSTVAMFSDFMMDTSSLIKGLNRLTGSGLKGFLVMVLDPQEVDFKFKGHVEFQGMEGEGKKSFKKVETMRSLYQEKMRDHILEVQRLSAAKGFQLIIQRTDEPLHDALLAIYGLSSKKSPAHTLMRPEGLSL